MIVKYQASYLFFLKLTNFPYNNVLFYKKSQTKVPQFLRGLIDYLHLRSGISFGNDKSKSRVQIAIANLDCKPRARPTFAFLSFPKEIPLYTLSN